MDYVLVGVYVDEYYEEDVRKIHYLWSDYDCKFTLKSRDSERSKVKITALLVLDLSCFSLVKLKIEDCLDILDELGIGDEVTKGSDGLYYRYWSNIHQMLLYPMLSEDSDSVILPNSLDKSDIRKINSLCNIKIVIPAVYTTDKEEWWGVDLFVSLRTKSIAIGYDYFVIKEIQGSIENSDLSNNSHLKSVNNIKIGDYLDLQDFGGYFVLLNNAVIYGDSSEDIISNGVERIIYRHYHENPHLDIVVPPSVKKICIAYDRYAKRCSTTFMFSKAIDLSDIEFEFCDFTLTNEAFSKLKTTLIDLIENELERIGINIAYYG